MHAHMHTHTQHAHTCASTQAAAPPRPTCRVLSPRAQQPGLRACGRLRPLCQAPGPTVEVPCRDINGSLAPKASGGLPRLLTGSGPRCSILRNQPAGTPPQGSLPHRGFILNIQPTKWGCGCPRVAQDLLHVPDPPQTLHHPPNPSACLAPPPQAPLAKGQLCPPRAGEWRGGPGQRAPSSGRWTPRSAASMKNSCGKWCSFACMQPPSCIFQSVMKW